jgi:hypothetical protein
VPSSGAVSLRAMFAASAAFNMTFGLIIVFIVGLPVLVNVLLGFIAAQVASEHEENLEFQRQHPPA